MSGSCVAFSLPSSWDRFPHVWHLDFEFRPDRNRLPDVICGHALEHRSGREIALWKGELLSSTSFSFVEPDDVVIAYSAMAEGVCLHGLRKARPNIICPFTELMAIGNGRATNKHPSLIDAVEMLGGTPPISRIYKTMMRDKILSGQYDRAETQDYNRSDNLMTHFVLDRIANQIPIDHALFRGHYLWALADVEARGLPVDLTAIRELDECWQPIRRHYINRDDEFGLYDEELSFSRARLEKLVDAKGWDWPRKASGVLDISAITLREQARRYSALRSFQRLQSQVAELRLSKLLNTLGEDEYSRCSLQPFWTLTSRNLPQGEKDEGTGTADTVFMLSLPAWLRGYIRPPEGRTIVEVDFSAQEIVIASGLSGDPTLIEDAQHDPYLRFAARAGLIPWGADPNDRVVKQVRATCKICLLASLYGQTPFGLALRLGCSLTYAADLQGMLAEIYPVFWKWTRDVVAQAQFDLKIVSPFGWPLHVTASTKKTTLLNYKMQAGGSDALRLAVVAAYEAGIQICAPLHDSLWAMFPTNEYRDQLNTLQRIMARASVSVCGIPCGTKAETIVSWPDCLGDVRKDTVKGQLLWAEIQGLIRSGQVMPARQMGA
jgi:hypothetical protein